MDFSELRLVIWFSGHSNAAESNGQATAKRIKFTGHGTKKKENRGVSLILAWLRCLTQTVRVAYF